MGGDFALVMEGRIQEPAVPLPRLRCAQAEKQKAANRGIRGLSERVFLSFDVLVDELRHLEHVDDALAAEHGLELVVRIDVALVLLVLQAVALDVGPDLLGQLGARDRGGTDDRGERRARRHLLGDAATRLRGLLAGLLAALLRHAKTLLKDGTAGGYNFWSAKLTPLRGRFGKGRQLDFSNRRA